MKMLHRFSLLGIGFTISDQPPYADDSFNRASLDFFDRANDDASLHDSYFSQLAAFINPVFFQRELWHRAEEIWRRVVQPALSWEANHPGRYIHKGTPFYFWGMAAILRGELDIGFPLMHQALQEDVRTLGDQHPQTPAYRFATLDYTNLQEQAFRVWVEYQATYLSSFIDHYRASCNAGLSLDEFRRRFLASPPSQDLISQFTYTLGRFFLFDRVPSYARQNEFTSQLEINLLFDLLLVIDATIKVHNPTGHYFPQHAAYLSGQANLGLTQHKLQVEVNPAFQGDLSLTLANVLDGSFQLQDGSMLIGVAADLAVAYGLRNYGAHNLSSVPVVQQRFEQIRRSLFNVLFLTIETLYNP